jgi:hypothetical protein
MPPSHSRDETGIPEGVVECAAGLTRSARRISAAVWKRWSAFTAIALEMTASVCGERSGQILLGGVSVCPAAMAADSGGTSPVNRQ